MKYSQVGMACREETVLFIEFKTQVGCRVLLNKQNTRMFNLKKTLKGAFLKLSLKKQQLSDKHHEYLNKYLHTFKMNSKKKRKKRNKYIHQKCKQRRH